MRPLASEAQSSKDELERTSERLRKALEERADLKLAVEALKDANKRELRLSQDEVIRLKALVNEMTNQLEANVSEEVLENRIHFKLKQQFDLERQELERELQDRLKSEKAATQEYVYQETNRIQTQQTTLRTTLESENSHLRKIVDDLQLKLSQTDVQFRDLAEENERLKAQNKIEVDLRLTQSETLSTLRVDHQHLQEEKDHLNREVHKLRRELELKLKEIEEKNTLILRLEEERTALSRRLGELQPRQDELSSANSRNLLKIDKLETQLETDRARHHDNLRVAQLALSEATERAALAERELKAHLTTAETLQQQINRYQRILENGESAFKRRRVETH